MTKFAGFVCLQYNLVDSLTDLYCTVLKTSLLQIGVSVEKIK